MASLESLRLQFQPILPQLLKNIQQVRFTPTPLNQESADIQPLFPHTFGKPLLKAELSPEKRGSKPLKVGVVFSGGQAAGGHNVIAGLFDALTILHPQSSLIGFIDGPSGIIAKKYKPITGELLSHYRNLGGFDLLGSGRTKIETEEQLRASLQTVTDLKIDGLVIIGGDDSNTNAAILAEYFTKEKCPVKVIGVPKTIDGDLKNAQVAISFGFDTACKIYAEMIGNIARDALSAKKYTHFIKLMGRSASHIALECALKTHPNLTLIAEELGERQASLASIVEQIADLIEKRSKEGLNYGVILIPEGLIEFIPEIKELFSALQGIGAISEEEAPSRLSSKMGQLFQQLPLEIRRQILTDRDPHGNIQVSLIATEKLLIALTARELKEREKRGTYKGKFFPIAHFFGYEGRCGFPSSFDCNYCYSLGYMAALLIDEGVTGYMAYVENLKEPAAAWTGGGLPITSLLHLEERVGKLKPVIRKALVDLKGSAFALFAKEREKWAIEDAYLCPGPIQFYGDPALTDAVPLSL